MIKPLFCLSNTQESDFLCAFINATYFVSFLRRHPPFHCPCCCLDPQIPRIYGVYFDKKIWSLLWFIMVFLQLMMVFPIRNYPHQNVFLSTYLKTGLCQGLLGAFIIKMIGLVTCLAGEKHQVRLGTRYLLLVRWYSPIKISLLTFGV